MKNTVRKLTAWALTLMMLISNLPVGVLADTVSSAVVTEEDKVVEIVDTSKTVQVSDEEEILKKQAEGVTEINGNGVTVEALGNARIPYGAEPTVQQVSMDADAFLSNLGSAKEAEPQLQKRGMLRTAAKTMATTSTDNRSAGAVTYTNVLGFFDITIKEADGAEYQPAEDEAVRVSVSTGSLPATAGSQLKLYHIIDETGEIKEVTEVDFSRTDEAVTGFSFTATGFSIYVVVENGDTGDDARLSVVFHLANGSTKVMKVTKRQYEEGAMSVHVYDPGVGQVDPGVLFKGWTSNPEYTVAEKDDSLTIADIREEVGERLEGGIAEGDEVHYYPMLFNVYSVTYLDEAGLGIHTDELYKRSDDTSEMQYQFNQTYTPYANTDPDDPNAVAEFLGWQQIEPVGATDLIEVGKEITIDINYIVQAKVEFGHWISFNKNGSGASYTGPAFVLKSDTAISKKPTDPERKGFDFVEWCTDADCTTAFDWNSTIDDNITLFAKWEEHTRAYFYYNIWKQNVEGSGYDLAESILINNATVNNEITYST